MFKLLLALFLASSFLFWTGCCRCCTADCDINGGHFEIRLMRDGKNAVFGPDAFIHKDSIRVYHENQPLLDDFVLFTDTFQTIYLSIEEHSPIVLRLSSTMQDTFAVTTVVTHGKSCCPIVEVTSLIRNGQIICTEECEDVVIDVEI